MRKTTTTSPDARQGGTPASQSWTRSAPQGPAHLTAPDDDPTMGELDSLRADLEILSAVLERQLSPTLHALTEVLRVAHPVEVVPSDDWTPITMPLAQNTVTPIIGSDLQRLRLVIYNTGLVDIYLSRSPSGMLIGNATPGSATFKLPPGATLSLSTRAGLYALAIAGTGEVSVISEIRTPAV